MTHSIKGGTSSVPPTSLLNPGPEGTRPPNTPPTVPPQGGSGSHFSEIQMSRPPQKRTEEGESSTNPNRVKLTKSETSQNLLDGNSERSDSAHFSMSSSKRLGIHSMNFDDRSTGVHLSRNPSASSVTGEVVIPIPNDMQIGAQLRDIFKPHMTEANTGAFEALIAERSQRLHEMGETPESVAAVLSKGNKLDYAALATIGVVRSVPFAIASRAFDVVPALTSFVKTPAQAGAVVGAGSGAMDTVGSAILKNSTSDVTWMTAQRDQLAPVMAEAKDAVQPSGARLAGEVSAAFQTYTGRNMIRTAVAPLAEHAFRAAEKSPITPAIAKTIEAKVGNIDSWIAAAGGPVAGGAAYVAMEAMSQSAHRSGPEFLLGRTDWEAQFTALKNLGVADVAKSVAARAAALPGDIVTDMAGGVRDLFTGTNLIKNGAMLAGGFAGVQTAKAAAVATATANHVGAGAVAAVKQAVNTVVSAPVFAGWTTADVMAGPALDKAKQGIQEVAGQIRAAGSTNPPPRVANDTV